MSDRKGDNQLERKKMKLLSVGKDMEEWREKQRSDRGREDRRLKRRQERLEEKT